MTSLMKNILIVGATGALGSEFTRRLHAQGKSIIATGRRQNRLDDLKTVCPGLETLEWDVNDLTNLGAKALETLAKYPNIDTVFLAAGYVESFSFFQPQSTTDEKIIAEMNTDFTSRVILARHFLPHLQKLASSGKPANLMIMGSGLAFTPSGFYPVYCASQAASHSLTVALRQQIAGQLDATAQANLNIIQVVAPYVDTGFDAKMRDTINTILGGRAPVPMPLDEYMESAMAGLATLDKTGKPLKEVSVGFSQERVDVWRANFATMMEKIGMTS